MFKLRSMSSNGAALVFGLIFISGSHVFAALTPVTFGPPLVFNVPGIQFPDVVDLDGDGHLDIVAQTTAGFTVFYGTGNGTFTEVDYPIPLGTGYVFADFNGDGHLDIATTYTGQLGMILNTGNRQFGQPAYFGSGKIYGLCTGDFNNDGKPDLATADNGSGHVSVYLNDGSGGFLAPATYNVGGYLKDIQTADLNDDGSLDLIVSAHYNSTATILFGDGTGKFPTTGTAPAGGGNIVAGRFNYPNGPGTEGPDDLAGCNYWSDGLGVALNNGTGAFPKSFSYQTDQYPSVIYAGDLNGDGFNDLSIGQQGSNAFTVWLNDGTGSMTQQAPFITQGSDVHQPALGDFDEDGLPDVVVDGWTDHLSVYFNTTNPAPTASSVAPNTAAAGSPDLTIHITGTGFLKRSRVIWDTTPLATMFVSNTIIDAVVPAALLTTDGADTVSVMTAGPGGGTSSPVAFSVTGGIVRVMTAITLRSSSNPATVGQSLTLVAGLNAVGSAESAFYGNLVNLYDGGTLLARIPVVNGEARITLPGFDAGTHSFSVRFLGDGKFQGSVSSPLVEVVNKGTLQLNLMASANPSGYSQSVTLTAALAVHPGAPAPTGSVTFIEVNDQLAKPTVSKGVASYTTSKLAVGSNRIVAVYDGDANYVQSTPAVLTQVVRKQTTSTVLKVSSTQPVWGQPVLFKVTVAEAIGDTVPGGTVTISDGKKVIGMIALAKGTAELSVNPLSIGTHSIKAVYSGDNYSEASSSTASSITVSKRAITVNLLPSSNPAVAGQTVTIRANVLPVSPSILPVTGGMTMLFDTQSAPHSMLTVNGVARFTLPGITAGVHHLTVAYGGDPNSQQSSPITLTEKVNP